MSHRGDLTERMVLIPLLLAEHPRSQQDLARHFSVSGKTIKRDIGVLSAHYPIIEVREGRELQLFDSRLLDRRRYRVLSKRRVSPQIESALH